MVFQNFVRSRPAVVGIGTILGVSLTASFFHGKKKHGKKTVFANEPVVTQAYCKERNNSLDENWNEAVKDAKKLLQHVKDEYGCPGIVAAVNVNGKNVWSEGIGYSDIENLVPITPKHVLRIASISKVLTMTAVGRLVEDGKLDLDSPVQTYVPEFPENFWEDEKVTITTRHLVSHLSGIRHYDKKYMEETTQKSSNKIENDKDDNTQVELQSDKDNVKIKKLKSDKSEKNKKESGDSKFKEFYQTEEFKDVLDALKIFKDDPLVHKPGTKVLYSTHAWTLVSAVVQKAGEKQFLDIMKDLFEELGMKDTCAEYCRPLIYNRARFYHRCSETKKLKNVPYVDLSNKWAGGGFMSTVLDLTKFADAMLYSYQYSNIHKETSHLPGILQQDSIEKMWTPTPKAIHGKGNFGLGWKIVTNPQKYGHHRPVQMSVSHAGGAVGASSALLIIPFDADSQKSAPNKIISDIKDCHIPRGVTVALIVNQESVSLSKTAASIAELFSQFC